MASKSETVAYVVLSIEVVAIVILAYMRFQLHTLPLIPGINSGTPSLLGQQ